MPVLHFDEATHTYTLDGVQVPSVTRILKPLQDFGGIPAEVLARKAALGTAVHLATEYDDEGTLDEETVHPQVRPYLEAYRRWRTEMGVTVLGFEQQVFHPTLRYAGTYDLTALIEGQLWLIDKKTSAEPSPTWALQTAAYLACMGEADASRMKRAALQLKPDGRYRWIPYDRPENARDFAVFAGLVSLHYWKQANGL